MAIFRGVRLIILLLLSLCLVGCNNHNSLQGYVEGEYSYLASAVSGNLLQMLVTRGIQVTVGQPLFVLDPQPEADAYVQAQETLKEAEQNLFNLQKGQRDTVLKAIEAQREQAIANLDYTKKTYVRYQELYKTRAIDKASLDQAKSTYEQNLQRITELEANLAEAKRGARENLIQAQEAAVRAAQAGVKQAAWSLAQKKINAPAAGQIIDYLYEVGEFVTAGSPVVVLLPPNKTKVIFYVPEKIVHQMRIDDVVAATCDGCTKQYHLKVKFISPKSEYTPPVIFSQESRDKLVYRIEAYPDANEAAELHPGQPVDVKLIKN